MARNKGAPKDVRFCNGICQDFRAIADFSGTSNKKMMCNNCRNLVGLAIKQIDNNEITLEQFHDNPYVVHKQKIDVDSTKKCDTCKEDKPLLDYDTSRNNCKACISIGKSNKTDKVQTFINDIEKLKNNSHSLELFITKIPKDSLIQIISHFKVGRKSSDTKVNMISNLINYFKRIQNPFLCVGGCGKQLVEQGSICSNCDHKKEKKSHIEKIVDFEKNLEELMDNIIEIKKEDEYKFNKKQLLLMFKYLNCGSIGKKTKEELIELINKKLTFREKERKELANPLQTLINKKIIILNNMEVYSRPIDSYINATQLCKAGNKLFSAWFRQDSTHELVQTLSDELNIPTTELVEIKKGGDKYQQGTWMHPDLAIQLAQWISPMFALQVSRWIRELVLFGSLSLGHEKNEPELLELRKHVKQLEKIKDNHNSMLKKRQYYKFKKGPCFYIISDRESAVKKFKVGKEDVSIDTRLKSYRTSLPASRLEFLVYTDKNNTLETLILERHSQHKKQFQNHEWLYDIKLKTLKESVLGAFQYIGSNDYTIDDTIETYNDEVLKESSCED